MSNNLYSGHFVSNGINFFGKHNITACSEVPALIVGSAVGNHGYNVTKGDKKFPDATPEKKDVNEILCMGGGFSRNTEGNGLPYAMPSHNPFSSIDSVDGKYINDKSYCIGYTVSTKGMDLGPTTKNTIRSNWLKLNKGNTPVPRD